MPPKNLAQTGELAELTRIDRIRRRNWRSRPALPQAVFDKPLQALRHLLPQNSAERTRNNSMQGQAVPSPFQVAGKIERIQQVVGDFVKVRMIAGQHLVSALSIQ